MAAASDTALLIILDRLQAARWSAPESLDALPINGAHPFGALYVHVGDCVSGSEALGRLQHEHESRGAPGVAVLVAAECPDMFLHEAADAQAPALYWDMRGRLGASPDALVLRFPRAPERAFERLRGAVGDVGRSYFSGACDAPEFATHSALGPVSACVSRFHAEHGAANAIGRDLLGASATLLAAHPAFALGYDSHVETAFGVAEHPWSEGEVRLPGRIILDMDSYALDQFSRRIGHGESVAEALCPGCSATGDVCGDKCPDDCKNGCSEKNGKQCCLANGMPAPEYGP